MSIDKKQTPNQNSLNVNSIAKSMLMDKLSLSLFHSGELFMKFSIFTVLALVLLLAACGSKNEEQPANMEEIHREQGVPVRIQIVEHTEFVQELDYTMSVQGIRETRVYSNIADQVQSINARLGEVVEQDQIIINFPRDNVQASYFQAQAAYELAEQTVTRMRSLYETGGVSRQDLDGAETQFRVAEANWDAVQQAVNVRAPFRGMITDIDVREMQRVTPGGYLFTISQNNILHGRVWITEGDINLVRPNARVIFRWNDIEKQGRITNIALSLNTDNNAFAADVEINNADYAIRSGITGHATIAIYNNPNAIVVPRNIVQRDLDGQNFVFVAHNGYAQRRNVTVGHQSELSFEVNEGLSIGDILIIQGLQLVRDGVRLNVQE
ncbi:MAG: efflux RND transporter periplasmic adaptor subunit [Candidatus Cloacimonetes bacterium]|nr:efflux RND transporter periplasmic adaptor subunit [Candidatus Cloacimonadota bacterium]